MNTQKTYRSLMLHAAVLYVILFVLHLFAELVIPLYSIFEWFDSFMHVFGGIALGFLLYGMSVWAAGHHYIHKLWGWFVVFLAAILVGWEVFQFVVKSIQIDYFFDSVDSMWDVIWGAIGAGFAVWWGKAYCVKTNK